MVMGVQKGKPVLVDSLDVFISSGNTVVAWVA